MEQVTILIKQDNTGIHINVGEHEFHYQDIGEVVSKIKKYKHIIKSDKKLHASLSIFGFSKEEITEIAKLLRAL